jgi:caa(3)-type oxidase subunit IV
VTPRARIEAWTLLALLLLAGASFALSYVSLGIWTLPAALAVAGLKVWLVVVVFMRLGGTAGTPRLVAATAVLLALTLAGLAAADVATRTPGVCRSETASAGRADHLQEPAAASVEAVGRLNPEPDGEGGP